MNRVFDFTPAEHEVLVSRILVKLHQAVDEEFPHAQPASQRFAKTAFTGYDEPTLTQLVPSEALKEALEEERRANPLASDEEPLSGDQGRGFFGGKAAMTQTIIGLLALILVALIAYFVFATDP